jgi:PAS domain S-box-containing protein
MDEPYRHGDSVQDRETSFVDRLVPISHSIRSPADALLLEKTLKQYHESEQKYKHLVDIAPDAIFIADVETGIILDANQQAAQLLGIPVEQIIGMHQTRLHPDDETEKYRQLFEIHAKTGAVNVRGDIHVRSSDGQKIPVQINTTVTQIGSKTVMYGIFRDITEQQAMARKMAESERRYRELYHNAQVALFVTDLNGMLLDCNLNTLEFFGYSRDELPENYLNKVCVADYYTSRERRRQFVEALQKDGQVKQFEAELQRADGNRFWVSISAKLSLETGTIEGALYDITAEKVLTRTEKRVLDIILQGKSNKEIAKIMNRSIRTIEDHRAHIMQKLNANNLVELVQKGYSLKLAENHSTSPRKS